MKFIMTTDPNPEVADSEAESMIVHVNGDTHLDDLLSENECDTDVDIDTIEALHHKTSDSSSLQLEPRTKTRLLSRSHSVDDLNNQTENCTDGLNSEPPRRNSSGECPPNLYETDTPSPKPSPCGLSDLDLSRYKGNQQHRSSLTPTSSILQLSPVTVQYSSMSWNPPKVQEKDDNFTILLHSTAERVLTKLKSRQQDLGRHITRGHKSQKKHSLGLQPTVPRKLQPIVREGSKTPRSDSDIRSISGDSDLGPLSAA